MMNISPNTQAILMLVSPLLAGGFTEPKLLLTHREYTDLVKMLQQIGRQPADLLDKKIASDVLYTLEARHFDRKRLERLLGRGVQLGLALDHWQQRSIQVISRADDLYPQRLKKALQHQAPALLYVCGENIDLLQSGGLAVVGSRDVDAELLAYARNVGELAACADCTIVSGGAKGVDQAAMQGSAAADGSVIGVVANNLETVVMCNRNDLMKQRLLLCSPFDPAMRFQAWRAMERNKLIYALSDAALVVESDVGKGGTWQGAVEQIQKLKVVPVYTRTSGPDSAGLKALRAQGAHRWPEFDNKENLRAFMQNVGNPDKDAELPLFKQQVFSEIDSPRETLYVPETEAPAESPERPAAQKVAEMATSVNSYGLSTPLQDLTWEDRLFGHVEGVIMQMLEELGPLKRDEIATRLKTTKGPTGQTSLWLKRLLEADKIEKPRNSACYQIKKSEQTSLLCSPSESPAPPSHPVPGR